MYVLLASHIIMVVFDNQPIGHIIERILILPVIKSRINVNKCIKFIVKNVTDIFGFPFNVCFLMQQEVSTSG